MNDLITIRAFKPSEDPASYSAYLEGHQAVLTELGAQAPESRDRQHEPHGEYAEGNGNGLPGGEPGYEDLRHGEMHCGIDEEEPEVRRQEQQRQAAQPSVHIQEACRCG